MAITKNTDEQTDSIIMASIETGVAVTATSSLAICCIFREKYRASLPDILFQFNRGYRDWSGT